MGVWEYLADDLLKKIQEQHLTLLIDKFHFSCVCKSWQQPSILNRRRFQLPFLLASSGDGISQASYELFDMLEKKTYYLDLPAAQGKLFRGSSCGWLVTVEETPSIYLINPITGVKINLPPRTSFPDVKQYRNSKRQGKRYIMFHPTEHENVSFPAIHVRDSFLGKVILSSSPHLNDDYIAVAIYGICSEGLAYCKHGDKKWTAIPIPTFTIFYDIIFYKEQLYALDNAGTLYIIELGPCPKVIETKKVPPIRPGDNCKYLIDSSIGLLMVSRKTETFGPMSDDDSVPVDDSLLYDDIFSLPYRTIKLKVFMFDSSSCSWERVNSIGDNVLFLGHNSSISLSSDEFLGAGNKVYFTENLQYYYKNKINGGFDIGVFDLESGKIETLSGFNCDPRFVFPAPVWIIPNA